MSVGSVLHSLPSLESAERLASSGLRLMMPTRLRLQRRLLMKSRHVTADNSSRMQRAKTDFIDGIGVGYCGNNNADKKIIVLVGFHKHLNVTLNPNPGQKHWSPFAAQFAT